MLFRITSAVAVAAALATSAQAHAGPGPRDGVLAELPADAPPGDCYARVRIPGEPAGPPPAAMGARWVMSPGPYGSPGPIWCLVPTGPVAPPPPPVDRFGWIRVLCDRDATPERIGKIQHRLHERGYYRGGYDGRYDAATAEAVRRFQSDAHIAHGGYLSLDTLEALEAPYDGGAYAEGYRADERFGYARSVQSYSYESRSVSGGGSWYSSAYPAYPAYPGAAAPAPYPCCAPPPPPQPYPQPCCVGGYGAPQPAYKSRSAIQNGWLTWQNKQLF